MLSLYMFVVRASKPAIHASAICLRHTSQCFLDRGGASGIASLEGEPIMPMFNASLQ